MMWFLVAAALAVVGFAAADWWATRQLERIPGDIDPRLIDLAHKAERDVGAVHEWVDANKQMLTDLAYEQLTLEQSQSKWLRWAHGWRWFTVFGCGLAWRPRGAPRSFEERRHRELWFNVGLVRFRVLGPWRRRR